jgi:hypothetical protein
LVARVERLSDKPKIRAAIITGIAVYMVDYFSRSSVSNDPVQVDSAIAIRTFNPSSVGVPINVAIGSPHPPKVA